MGWFAWRKEEGKREMRVVGGEGESEEREGVEGNERDRLC